MQIVIIGAGIAGLSSYLFLIKHLVNNAPDLYDIKIYEAYEIRETKGDSVKIDDSDSRSQEGTTFAPKTIGSAIGIGKNGLAVLGRIDDDGQVLERLKQQGNCISKWKMGTARGWTLHDAIVESSPEKDGQRQVQPTVMVARQVAWKILRDQVLAMNSEAVTTAKVVGITPTEGEKVMITLEDGSASVVDLVIGADGLKSIVRKTMFETSDDLEPLSWWEKLLGRAPHTKDYITPHYEGLTGSGGIVPGNVLKQAGFKSGQMGITFGPNGFFGHGYLSPAPDSTASSIEDTSTAAWWSTFSSSTPYPFQEENTGDINTPDRKTAINKEAIMQQLRLRHGNWQDPVIQAIIEHVCKTSAVDNMYPTFTTPELPTWHKNNLVLIGDAAHALQPSSGQGACQALEDSETLARLLSHFLSPTSGEARGNHALTKALTTFEAIRKPRLAKIYEQSQKFGRMKGDMNVVQEFLMYFFIWLGPKLGAWRKYNDELFEYDLPEEVEKAVKGSA